MGNNKDLTKVLILSLILITFCALPVCADQTFAYDANFSGQTITSVSALPVNNAAENDCIPPFNFRASQFENTTGLSYVYQPEVTLDFFTASGTGGQYNANVQSYAIPVTAKIGVTVVGTGFVQLTPAGNGTQTDSGQFAIEYFPDNWDTSSATGLQVIRLYNNSPITNPYNGRLINAYLARITSGGAFSSSFPFGTAPGVGFVIQDSCAVPTQWYPANYDNTGPYGAFTPNIGIVNKYAHSFQNHFTGTLNTTTGTLRYNILKTADALAGYFTNSRVQVNDTSGQIFDQSGTTDFLNLPSLSPPATFRVTDLGYSSKVFIFQWPSNQSTYSLSATPQNGTLLDTWGLQLTRNDGGVISATQLNYQFQDTTNNFGNFRNFRVDGTTFGLSAYSLISGTWYAFNESSNQFDINVGILMPTTVNLKLPQDYSGTGVTPIQCYIQSLFLPPATATGSITINPSGKVPVQFTAMDGNTGNLLTSWTLNVQDIATSTWTNLTLTDPSVILYFPPKENLKYTGFAANYGESTPGYVTSPTADKAWTTIVGPILPGQSNQTPSVEVIIPLYRNDITVPVANATVTVRVQTQDSLPLSGATVYLSDNQVAYTSSSGQVQFTVINNSYYSANATRPGFGTTGSSPILVSGLNPQNLIVITMGFLTPTPTITSGFPTATITPGGSQTVAPSSTGFWGPWVRSFTIMGADPGTVNILLTAMLVLILGIIAGVATRGNPGGFSAGASLGFLFSCAFGFIWFWFIIAGIAWLLGSFFLYRQF